MEISFKCPTCGRITIDVKGGTCMSTILCPHCLKNGISAVMLEQKTDNYQNMGGGLFTKRPSN